MVEILQNLVGKAHFVFTRLSQLVGKKHIKIIMFTKLSQEKGYLHSQQQARGFMAFFRGGGGGVNQLFAVLQKPLILLASLPVRELLENGVLQTGFVHVLVCVYVCGSENKRANRRGVGYQSETFLKV